MQRLTKRAGFGFFHRDVFRTYRVYLSQCVQFQPQPTEIYEFAMIASAAGDASAALTGGVKLLQAGDKKGIALLEKAAEWGSVDALSQLYLAMARDETQILCAIERLRSFTCSGHTKLWMTVGVLYERLRNSKLAKDAYRTAVNAGFDEAEVPLAYLLLDDPATKEEGRGILRRAVTDDFSGAIASRLGLNLASEIGKEEEAALLLQRAVDRGYPSLRLWLASLYVGWPGHLNTAEVVREHY